MSILRKFMEKNKKISENFLNKNWQDKSIYDIYVSTVAKHIKDNDIMYDIGGGKRLMYGKALKNHNAKVYGVDISDKELEANAEVCGKIVTDVCREIPLPHGKVDMITSSSVLEHLRQPEAFFANAYKSLKPGGYFIHVCPCRYAVFAVINRLLPHKLSRKILFFFKPEAKGTCGFPAYYKELYMDGIKKMLDDTGFELVGCYTDYRQSSYYTFFFPLFLINYGWDRLMYRLRLKNMAAYILFVAKKPVQQFPLTDKVCGK